MASLEDKIKALLEGTDPSDLQEKETIKTKGGTTIVDDDGDGKDDADEKGDDKDEEGDDEGDDSPKTKVSQDPGAEPDGDEDGADTDGDGDGVPPPAEDEKVKTAVKEDIDPHSGKLNAASFNNGNGGIESGAAKTAKLKVGMGRKQDTVTGKKIGTLPTSGAKDDNGDNAKMTKNLQGGSSGKLTGPAAGGSQNDANARNQVDTNPQSTGKSPFGGMKEHMDAMFSGEELTEEFKTKASTIFEAAVEAAAADRIVQIQEETQLQLDEAVEEVKAELVEQIDGFINLMVEQWIDDNAVALEGSMKVELSNSFIDGLKGLFKEHYFDIPEDKLDVVEEQAKEISDLQTEAQQAIETANALQEELVALKRELVFESVAAELTKTEKEKFATLSENIAYTSDEEFTQKLNTVKGSYFPKSIAESAIPQDDTPAMITEEVRKNVDGYVDAIAKNLKF